MLAYLSGVLGLFDGVLRALMGLDVLAFFLYFTLFCLALSLALMLKRAAHGRARS